MRFDAAGHGCLAKRSRRGSALASDERGRGSSAYPAGPAGHAPLPIIAPATQFRVARAAVGLHDDPMLIKKTVTTWFDVPGDSPDDYDPTGDLLPNDAEDLDGVDRDHDLGSDRGPDACPRIGGRR